MATKIELPKDLVRAAITLKVGSVLRAAKAATNPIIKEALEKEVAAYNVAIGTITEVK